MAQTNSLPPAGTPDEAESRKVRRMLIAGYLLLIALLGADCVIGVSTILSIRQSVSTLTEDHFRSVVLIDEVQRAQSALGSVLHGLSTGGGNMDPERLNQAAQEVEDTLAKLFGSIPPDDPDIRQWREVERAFVRVTSETEEVLEQFPAVRPDLRRLMDAREGLLAATAELIRSNHRRAEETNRKIREITSYQLFEDGVLLTGCLLIACFCVWLTLRITGKLYGRLTAQNAELGRVTWQLLDRQENLARRLSHELHDELGQTLTALKTNFTRHAMTSQADRAWISDCTLLLKDSIRSAHEISQLLRPTILDDFGLDSALAWLCERFEERNGIEVSYHSHGSRRLTEEAETHLFRIAQEALTNVARHARATEVSVVLSLEGEGRLTVADNGVGLGSAPDSTRPHFGLTGMRARARTLSGEMVVQSSPGCGVEIQVTFPYKQYERKEKDSHPVGG